MCLVPKPQVIVKFPRPDTGDQIYKAHDGSCFKAVPRKVDCKDAKLPVVPQPVQSTAAEPDSQGISFRLPEFLKTSG